jgi:hypothetical protein
METNLLLISRDDILKLRDSHDGDRLYRAMARLTRSGFRFLATAPQPDDWSARHGGPDEALLGPVSIRKKLKDAGGEMDGVYYVARSSLTQRRNREQALNDILERYSIKPDHCYLFSSSRKFSAAAASLGIQAAFLGPELSLVAELKQLLTLSSN